MGSGYDRLREYDTQGEFCVGSKVPGAFSPLTQANLLAWWAPELATKDGSNNVLTQPSYGGTASETLTPPGTAPVWSATALNGKPGLTFTAASSQALQKTSSAVAAATAGVLPFSLYMVLRIADTSVQRNPFTVSAASGTNRWMVYHPSGTGFDGVVHGPNNQIGNKSLASACVFSAVYDGATYSSWVNGVQSINAWAGGLDAGSTTIVTLGADYFSAALSGYWDGAIGDVIVRNVADSSTARGQHEAYLKAKYAL